jgi:hypothetical protein
MTRRLLYLILFWASLVGCVDAHDRAVKPWYEAPRDRGARWKWPERWTMGRE